MHCFSICLHNSQGMSENNINLLKQLARLVRNARGQWVVGGDWNLVPEALAKSGWVEEMEGKIFATKAPTCGTARLEHFVVDRRLGPAVAYVKRLSGFGTAPHHPIRLALRAEPRRLM